MITSDLIVDNKLISYTNITSFVAGSETLLLFDASKNLLSNFPQFHLKSLESLDQVWNVHSKSIGDFNLNNGMIAIIGITDIIKY